jgi:hypothetical protein
MNSQLNFFDFLCTDLELKTEVEDPNQGAEMIVIQCKVGIPNTSVGARGLSAQPDN